MVLVALGLAIVITCTRAGYPLRFLWCMLFNFRFTRWLWNLVLCPHCCSFWTGFAVGYAVTGDWIKTIQIAVTACGVMYVLQKTFSRDRIVAADRVHGDRWVLDVRGVAFEPPEDFEEILGIKNGLKETPDDEDG